MKKIITLTAAAMLTACAALAESADFNPIIARVLARNPQLAADSLSARADLLTMAAEGNLPDPEVAFDHKWPTVASDGTRWGLEVSQSFDWPGVYAARNKAIGAARRAEELMALSRLKEKALEVRLLLIDIVDANLRVATLSQVKENMDTMVELTREMYDRGNATVLTLKKMEFERYSTESALSDAQVDLDRLRADLAAMAGGELIDTDGLTEYPAQTLHEESVYTAASVPSISAMVEKANADRLTARAEKLKRMPGFSVGYLHEYEEGMHFNGFSVGMTLPFFSTRHTVGAAKARAEAAEASLESARLARAAAVRAGHSEAMRLKRRVEAYHSIFGSDNYPELLRRAYSKGQMTAHEYLGEVNEYLTLYMEHLATERAYMRSLATLNSSL